MKVIMIKLEFTAWQIKSIKHYAYYHPHVQRKMCALSLKYNNVANKTICSSLNISENTLRNYFK